MGFSRILCPQSHTPWCKITPLNPSVSTLEALLPLQLSKHQACKWVAVTCLLTCVYGDIVMLVFMTQLDCQGNLSVCVGIIACSWNPWDSSRNGDRCSSQHSNMHWMNILHMPMFRNRFRGHWELKSWLVPPPSTLFYTCRFQTVKHILRSIWHSFEISIWIFKQRYKSRVALGNSLNASSATFS